MCPSQKKKAVRKECKVSCSYGGVRGLKSAINGGSAIPVIQEAEAGGSQVQGLCGNFVRPPSPSEEWKEAPRACVSAEGGLPSVKE